MGSLEYDRDVSTALVLDKRLAFTQRKVFGVSKGARFIDWAVTPASSSSNNSTTWNVQPPNPDIAISKELLYEYEFQVVFTCSSPGTNGLCLDIAGGFDCPASFPINQIIETFTPKVNTSSAPLNSQNFVNVLPWLNTKPDQIKKDLSYAPSMLDQNQNFSDVLNVPSCLGVANSPMQPAGQNSFYPTRGGWEIYGPGGPGTAITNTSSGATVLFKSREPFFGSPFSQGEDDDVAFINVQTMTINVTLGALSRVWSHSDSVNASTISGITVTIVGQPNILATFITPPEGQVIPKKNIYNYSTLNWYNTATNQTLTPYGTSGASITFTTNNIQLTDIPRRFIIWVPRQEVDRNITTPNTFCRIDSAIVNFNGVSSQLSGANSLQLWKISRDAGLEMSWSQWNNPGRVGSILVLDVTKSLFLTKPDQAPSITNTTQFQIKLGITNLNTVNNITPTVWIGTISDGLLTIDGNHARFEDSVLRKADVLALGSQPEQNSFYQTAQNWYGAALIDTFRSAGAALIGGSRRIVERVRNNRGESSSFVGAGLEEQEEVDQEDEITGGAMVSKSTLKQRAMERARTLRK